MNEDKLLKFNSALSNIISELKELQNKHSNEQLIQNQSNNSLRNLFEVPPNTLCYKCNNHKATLIYTVSTFEAIHGNYTYLCACCCYNKQLEETMAIIKNLPLLIENLIKSSKEDCK